MTAAGEGTAVTQDVLVLRADGTTARVERPIAVERPVAVEIDGLGYAVLMMTPADLPAFVAGFLLTERLIDRASDLLDLDLFDGADGVIARATLHPDRRGRTQDRVRHRSTDTSCGLCGIAGLEQLRRPVVATPPRPQATTAALFAAQGALRAHQPLNARTGAVHAAAACDADGRPLRVFEDVGRHNALDKLVGWAAMEGVAPAFVLVTSRVSYEMVDKALVMGTGLLVGVSAPTALAIEHARTHGLTLVALARADAMLVVHDPWRIFASGSEGGT